MRQGTRAPELAPGGEAWVQAGALPAGRAVTITALPVDRLGRRHLNGWRIGHRTLPRHRRRAIGCGALPRIRRASASPGQAPRRRSCGVRHTGVRSLLASPGRLEQFQPDRKSRCKCVIPAPAGTQAAWVPACTGMTRRTRSGQREGRAPVNEKDALQSGYKRSHFRLASTRSAAIPSTCRCASARAALPWRATMLGDPLSG